MRRRRHAEVRLLPSPLIGRDQEIAAACERLRAGDTRLLTLTGPPGVGKTSLALSVAQELAPEYRHGVTLIDLAPVDDPDAVLGAICDGLGVRRSRDGSRTLLEQAMRVLQERRLLLVLDNFEQVVTAAPVLADLLATCAGLTAIVTSRVPLRLRWEWELPVSPLAVPSLGQTVDPETLADLPSVALFVERARAVNPSFALSSENAALIGDICAALDGLPLAIELAAARVRTLTPRAMHGRLVGEGRELSGPLRSLKSSGRSVGSPLSWLTDGPRDLPARQQSLRDAISWSYELLDPAEQQLLRRLSIFVGGCTFEAAATVCDGTWESLTALVEQSLLRYEQPAAGAIDPGAIEPRLRLLETVRHFAAEQLTVSGERETIERRHVAFFVDLAEQAEPELLGAGQAVWMERLGEEYDNLRAATRMATAAGDVERVLRLGAALMRFWRARGDPADTRERVDGIVALAESAPPIPATFKALWCAGDLSMLLGDYQSARTLFEQSLAVARGIDDPPGLATALRALSKVAGHQGRYDDADSAGLEALALFEDLGDLAGVAITRCQLGLIANFRGEQLRAREHLEWALTAARRSRDQRVTADSAFALALSHHVSGNVEIAWPLYEECLAVDRAHGHRTSEGSVLNNLGHLAIVRGDLEQARLLLHDSLIASRDGGDRRRLGMTVSAVAVLAAVRGESEEAVRLNAAALAGLEAMAVRLNPSMRAMYDAQLEPARASLDDASIAAAEAAGRLLSLDQVVDEALSWLVERPAGSEPEGTVPATAVALALDGAVSAASSQAAVGRPGPAVLTRRERDVATLLGQGLTTNRQIAAALVITEGTAANYVQRVMNRLELRTRAQVAAWAVERKLHERQQVP